MRTFYDAKRMREEVNTEQGTANKKSEIPPFLRSKKEGKLSDFLCSCSAVVLARSRSHYLCIRKNLSAQRPSRLYIKNSKWKILPPHQHETWKPGSEERTKEKPYFSDHPKAQTAKSGTYHKCDNGDGGLARKCSIAMRRSYHCPCSMMTERMPP